MEGEYAAVATDEVSPFDEPALPHHEPAIYVGGESATDEQWTLADEALEDVDHGRDLSAHPTQDRPHVEVLEDGHVGSTTGAGPFSTYPFSTNISDI